MDVTTSPVSLLGAPLAAITPLKSRVPYSTRLGFVVTGIFDDAAQLLREAGFRNNGDTDSMYQHLLHGGYDEDFTRIDHHSRSLGRVRKDLDERCFPTVCAARECCDDATRECGAE